MGPEEAILVQYISTLTDADLEKEVCSIFSLFFLFPTALNHECFLAVCYSVCFVSGSMSLEYQE